MPRPPIDSLFTLLQKAALPGVWSKGLALARDKGVILDAERADEIILRVKESGKPVSFKVSLWPEDEDSHCDCESKADPCVHRIAAIVALKNGWAQGHSTDPAGAKAGASSGPFTRLVYRLVERDGALAFQRWIARSSAPEEQLRASLVSHVGGQDSGRIASAPLPVTREDFKVDQVVSQLQAKSLMRGDVPDPRGVGALLSALRDIPRVELGATQVEVRAQVIRHECRIEDDAGGVGVRLLPLPAGGRAYSNGIFFRSGVIQPIQPLSKLVREASGRSFGPGEWGFVVTQLIPLLEAETHLEIKTSRLPKFQALMPRILLEVDRDPMNPEALEIMPRLVYGDPEVAEVFNDKLALVPGSRVVVDRDPSAERIMVRELQAKLHLQPRQRVRLSGREAVDFLQRSARWDRRGAGLEAFAARGEVVPVLRGEPTGLIARFELPGGEGGESGVDAARVLSAWRRGESMVPLLEGGWASIPEEWLRHNADQLDAFLAMKKPSMLQKLEIAEFCAESNGVVSADLSELRERLTEFKGIPEQPLPTDLKAELRDYQRTGVNWLGFLRESGLGALLADDMGLGKTLQALCAVRGRTLVIAPTSVLPAWESQIRRFRPGLKLNIYYGGARKLDSAAELILTTYGVLRQDRALLTADSWDSIILDEAQNIKNPTSQIARIAHELRGKFRVALSGTPIENRLDDLWSQMQFVQPGLLGSRDEFQGSYGTGELEGLRRRIRPLILRRMKREVAPELPPKTETLLYSLLNEAEQKAYRTVFAAIRNKVVDELESGGSVLAALEALLRLRQICAHSSLVPGFEEKEFKPSSKLELLRETLEESLALGHSVLIFTQWTSFLDLVEITLKDMGVEFIRLDGSTRNRGEVVERFQDPSGPRVMIISLKAGGTGLTLTKADHVIILDPWWNPAVEDQAADRAHRIGQTQPVLVQRLVAKDTVEERIVELQLRKRQLAEQALGPGGDGARGGAMELTREDLMELLRPQV